MTDHTNAQVALQAAVAHSRTGETREHVLRTADIFKRWLDEQDAKVSLEKR